MAHITGAKDPIHAYHECSKHHPDRYAPGPGHLDWETQPDPFRRYAGASQLDLPLLSGDLPVCWGELFEAGGAPEKALNADSLACLLQLSLGLSAWKSHGGNRWALRCNPSSGNLHPTEGYVICPDLPGLPAGVYHYRPDQHCLERRATAPPAWSGGLLLALTGIHWREAWKYGVRAFRYCQHDCGHALAAISYAASALGWTAHLATGWSDDEIAAVTGIDRAADFAGVETEAPEAMIWIGPGKAPLATAVVAALAGVVWTGTANALSSGHRGWPGISEVAAATRKPLATQAQVEGAEVRARPSLPALKRASSELVTHLIRVRRSAQEFDGVTAIDAGKFYRMLDALLPRERLPPWSLTHAEPCVHLVLFVHRVSGIEPGVYCLPRTQAALDRLRAAMSADWLWQRDPGAPAHLPLYLLAPMDVRQFARAASCHQDIAADSAFALAMLSRFDDIGPTRAWLYRQRFWEAGMLGQVLYLEAEAAGVQGTGIGCYFDDYVHRSLGLDTSCFQDIYHFTVGKAVVDPRLGTEAAYAHLEGRAGQRSSIGTMSA